MKPTFRIAINGIDVPAYKISSSNWHKVSEFSQYEVELYNPPKYYEPGEEIDVEVSTEYVEIKGRARVDRITWSIDGRTGLIFTLLAQWAANYRGVLR